MTTRLRVVLMWHMHQPDYRHPSSRAFMAPWTGLHALKDYADMAAHSERQPRCPVVVNFTPVLLDQLLDLAQRLANHLATGAPVGEPLLDALAEPTIVLDRHGQHALLGACLHAHDTHQIDRFPEFRALTRRARAALESVEEVDDHLLFDLVTWYHLAWFGEFARREDPVVRALVGQKGGFTHAQRRELLELVAREVAGVVPRFRALADAGAVELSTTPWGHPILPLLLGFSAAHETRPDAPLPATGDYPGGEARVRRHLEEAIRAFRDAFGRDPGGCWPSEGAVCARSVPLVGDAGFAWVATGGGVLRHSLGRADLDTDAMHRPYRLDDEGPWVFFRDDELSDLVGFTYKGWHGDDAVSDLVHRLERIAQTSASPGRVVTIALDGENPWEHYPANGWYFLSALYDRLADHPTIEMTTFSRVIGEQGIEPRALPRLVAGSWVYGDLATWIGERDKNRAWDMLVHAKRAYDARGEGGDAAALERQLAVCEGSDWFWWPGEYNPELAVSRFERLFRMHLAGLYRALGAPLPRELDHPFAHGRGQPAGGGTMQRGA